jgi:hypothetical protein
MGLFAPHRSRGGMLEIKVSTQSIVKPSPQSEDWHLAQPLHPISRALRANTNHHYLPSQDGSRCIGLDDRCPQRSHSSLVECRGSYARSRLWASSRTALRATSSGDTSVRAIIPNQQFKIWRRSLLQDALDHGTQDSLLRLYVVIAIHIRKTRGGCVDAVATESWKQAESRCFAQVVLFES